MAGDWIKVEAATVNKPEVIKAARLLGVSKDELIGKLIRLWIWFDTNSVDGRVDGVVSTDVDDLVGFEGFASVIAKIGWLDFDDDAEYIELLNFSRHNGESAKKRASKAKRQSNWRKNAKSGDGVVAQMSTDASTTLSTSAPTREEKRREEERREDDKSPRVPQRGEWDEVFPSGSLGKSRGDQKRIKALRAHPMLIRLGKLFDRKESTMPTVAESMMFRELSPPEEEIKRIEKYYKSGSEYLRQDLDTLLCNWQGELDRGGSARKSAVMASSSHLMPGGRERMI